MKWIRKIVPHTFQTFFSDEHNKIVFLKKGVPKGVFPTGQLTVGLPPRGYDGLLLIDLRPQVIEIKIDNSILTSDGVEIVGTISLTVKIVNDNSILLRVAQNAEKEEQIFIKSIIQGLQIQISSETWIDLVILTKEKLDNIRKSLTEYINNTDTCLSTVDVINISLQPKDKEYARLLEQRKKDEEIEKNALQQLLIQKERKRIEAEIEKDEFQKKKEREQEMFDMKLLNLEKEQASEIEKIKKQAKAENEIFEARLELLKNHPSALALLNPSLFEQIELAKIQAQSKQNEILMQIYKIDHSEKVARNDGKITTLESIVNRQFNINEAIEITNKNTLPEKEEDTDSDIKESKTRPDIQDDPNVEETE